MPELGGRHIAVIDAIKHAEALDEVLVPCHVVDLLSHDATEVVVIDRIDAAARTLAPHQGFNFRVCRVVAKVLHQLP